MCPAYQGWCRRASRGFRSGTPALFGSLPVFLGWSGRLPVPPGWSGCLPVPLGWSGPSFLLSLAFLVMQWKVVPHKEIVPRGSSCWCRGRPFQNKSHVRTGEGGDVPRRHTCRCKFQEETHAGAEKARPQKKHMLVQRRFFPTRRERSQEKHIMVQRRVGTARKQCWRKARPPSEETRFDAEEDRSQK